MVLPGDLPCDSVISLHSHLQFNQTLRPQIHQVPCENLKKNDAINAPKLFISTIGVQPVLRKVLILGRSTSQTTPEAGLSYIEVQPNMESSVQDLLRACLPHEGAAGQAQVALPSPFLRQPATQLLTILQEAQANASLASLRNNPATSTAAEVSCLLDEWSAALEALLASIQKGGSAASGAPGSSGPCLGVAAELERQRQEAMVLKHASKAMHEGVTLAICSAAAVLAPAALKRWQNAEGRVLEAAVKTEERETVLLSLQPVTAPLESGKNIK